MSVIGTKHIRWCALSSAVLAGSYLLLQLVTPRGGEWNPPYVLTTLNMVVFVLTALVVAALAAQAFALDGSSTLLLIGAGILVFGVGIALGPILLSAVGTNVGVTTHNLISLLAAVMLVVAGSFQSSVGRMRRWRGLMVALAYGSALACAAIIAVVAVRGGFPLFIGPDDRGTAVRSMTVGLASLLFLIAAAQTGLAAHRFRLRFMQLLAHGMALVAAGLIAVGLAAVGSPLSWTGRLAQDLGLALVLGGFVVAARSSDATGRAATIALSFRQLQTALEEAQDTAAELIRYAPTAICEIDLATRRFLSINDVMCELSGYSREELLGMDPILLVEDSYRTRIELVRAGLEAGVGPGQIDLLARTKNGRLITVSLRTRISYAEDGTPATVFVIAHDVTERAQAERKSTLAAQRLELALNAGGMAMWDWDFAANVTVWNDAHYLLLGYAVGEVEAGLEPFLARVHEGDRDAVRAGLESVLQRGGDFSTSLRITSASDAPAWIELWGQVELGADGSPLRCYGVFRDVTERKSRELALERSRQALATAERVGHTGNWRWDIRTGELQWSEGEHALYGVEPGEFVSNMDAFMDLIHPDDRSRVARVANEFATTGGELTFDFRIIRPDGVERILDSKGQVIEYDDDGRPLIVLGVNQDVTERREAQRALKESEELERRARQSAEALLETATALAAGVTRHDVLDTVCDLALSITGHTRATIALADEAGSSLAVSVSRGLDPIPERSQMDSDRMSAEAREILAEKWASVVDYDALGSIVPSFRGEVRSHLACVVPLVYQDNVLGLLTVDDPAQRVDFTSWEREFLEGLGAQAAMALTNTRLIESERQGAGLASVLAELKASLLSRADAGDTLDRALCASLDVLQSGSASIVTLTDDEVNIERSQDPAGLFSRPETVELMDALVRSCTESGGATELCAGSRPITGGAVVRMAVGVADDGAGRLGVVFAREGRGFSQLELQFVADFAEGFALATREKRVRGEREWLASSRQEWLSGVSHDLRTPLSSIRGYAQLLADDDETPPEEVHRQAGIIVEQAARLQSLVADMLLTFQIKEGALPMSIERIDIAEVLQRVEFSVTTDPRSRGREVSVECPALDHRISADSRLLERAIQNVAVNALTHNPEGTHVRLIARRVDGAEEIAISDDGRGMNAEQLQRIWVRYERSTGVGSDTDGVGLGVSISRQLVESMGGTISISSTEGVGTTVTMRFAALENEAPAHEPGHMGPAAVRGATLQTLEAQSE